MSLYSWRSSASHSSSSSSSSRNAANPYNMSSSSNGGSFGVAQRATSWQERLDAWCKDNRLPQPAYNILSDRRGKRTAWSCTVTLQTGQSASALYWYDGQFVNGAKEDAAEQACRQFGVPETEHKFNGVASGNRSSMGRVEGWGAR